MLVEHVETIELKQTKRSAFFISISHAQIKINEEKISPFLVKHKLHELVFFLFFAGLHVLATPPQKGPST